MTEDENPARVFALFDAAEQEGRLRRTRPPRSMTVLIRWYQRHLSHLTPPCPQDPSCSEWGEHVASQLGWRAAPMILFRILTCNKEKQ